LGVRVKAVITGGAGYIGSVATRRLADRGDDVVVIDNLSQGHRGAVSAEIPVVAVDISDAASVLDVFREYRPDAVLHFAALTIASESVRDPGPYWRVNVGGTLNVLEAMRDVGVPIIVMSSTAAVYGSPERSPVAEDAPLAPINPYGASKLAAERAVASYAGPYGIAFAALRYFNVAGAAGELGEDHRPETHLIPSALEAAAGRRQPLSLFGSDFPTPDGTAIRDYVHVADLIDAHLLALDYLCDSRTPLGAVNLGTRDGASVREVLRAVERITGMAVPVTGAPRRAGDPAKLVADARLARSLLGWDPRRSTLEEMIGSAWDWRKSHPGGYE
jgi:UDP-glucose-4-epimerase GalE